MLNVDKIFVSFQKAQVLRGASIKLRAAECVVLRGRSGGGKTTLLRAIAGLIPVQQGKITIDDRLILYDKDKWLADNRASFDLITSVFQQQNLWPNLTIEENLSLVLHKSKDVRIDERALSLLAKLSVDDLLDKFPLQCSVGQRQRIAVARALLGPSKYILMDEPTSALDSQNRAIMRDLIKAEIDKKRGFLIISHDDRDFDGVTTGKYELEHGVIEPVL